MRAKFTVSENMAMQMDAGQWDAFVKLAAMDAGQLRVDNWLREQKLTGRCRVGVIGVLSADHQSLMARARCILQSGGEFFHEEPYITFPSDHFKAKIMLVCG